MEATAFDTVNMDGIEVCYLDELDGGGRRLGHIFIEQVESRIEPVDRLFEWCAGPGFIGFLLLARGRCRHLTLADVNPLAVEAARETVRRNGLKDRVDVHLSDNLADIPGGTRWDLVVGNPPHFPAALTRHIEDGFVLRSVDTGFSLHDAFYRDVRRFLAPGATILVMESVVAGDHRGLFETMLETHGLELIEPMWTVEASRNYHVWSRVRS